VNDSFNEHLNYKDIIQNGTHNKTSEGTEGEEDTCDLWILMTHMVKQILPGEDEGGLIQQHHIIPLR